MSIQRRKWRERHGMRYTPIYRAWLTMVGRCHNPNHTRYKYYGAKGVVVCERWHLFTNFYADMGERPEGYTIDRIDVTKGYEPSNCRWATWTEQQNNKRYRIDVADAFPDANNRRGNIIVKMPDGRKLTASQAAKESGFSPKIIFSRIRLGWPESLLLTPPRRGLRLSTLKELHP